MGGGGGGLSKVVRTYKSTNGPVCLGEPISPDRATVEPSLTSSLHANTTCISFSAPATAVEYERVSSTISMVCLHGPPGGPMKPKIQLHPDREGVPLDEFEYLGHSRQFMASGAEYLPGWHT